MTLFFKKIVPVLILTAMVFCRSTGDEKNEMIVFKLGNYKVFEKEFSTQLKSQRQLFPLENSTLVCKDLIRLHEICALLLTDIQKKSDPRRHKSRENIAIPGRSCADEIFGQSPGQHLEYNYISPLSLSDNYDKKKSVSIELS